MFTQLLAELDARYKQNEDIENSAPACAATIKILLMLGMNETAGYVKKYYKIHHKLEFSGDEMSQFSQGFEVGNKSYFLANVHYIEIDVSTPSICH